MISAENLLAKLEKLKAEERDNGLHFPQDLLNHTIAGIEYAEDLVEHAQPCNCGTCHWYSEEHCVNADSTHCSDPRIHDQVCECWKMKGETK